MPTCIYCLEVKDGTGFTKREHVLPESFGLFRNNLTLLRTVCDDCNAHFGRELELPFARDTPEGLERFLVGLKDPGEYKSLGRRSTMAFRFDEGPFAGAAGMQTPRDGEMKVQPLPQIVLSRNGEPPFHWYGVDALPSKEVLTQLFNEGYRRLDFVNVENPAAVVESLRLRGVQHGDLFDPPPPEFEGKARIEWTTTLGDTFGRTITKIVLNYLASQFGATTALMATFDDARRYARFGNKPERRVWRIAEGEIIDGGHTGNVGHAITLGCEPDRRLVMAQVSFHNARRYEVVLAHGDGVVEPRRSVGHFFDLVTKEIMPMRQSR